MNAHYDPYRTQQATVRQAAAPSAGAYAPPRPRYDYLGPVEQASQPEAGGLRLDGLAVAALIIVAFLILQTIRDRVGESEVTATIDSSPEAAVEQAAAPEIAVTGGEAAEESEVEVPPPAPQIAAADPWAISYPYDEYWLTQGPHGYSYGHAAIDLAAGKGEPIKSPIHGQVTANYVDEYGNTTLVIENDVYAVTMLHGNYSAQPGQEVSLGQVVGSEWNHGYTLDIYGQSCRGRDCGYHTHLNVYSKVNQANVNPLDVLQ